MRRSGAVPLAVCASLALHAGALACLDRMPRGAQLAERSADRFGPGILQARLAAPALGEELVPAPLAPAARPALQPAVVASAPPSFGVVAPTYLPVSELDEKPLIRVPVHPEFPAFAPVSEGRVLLRVFIAETGHVDEVAVVSAAPARVFDEAAIRAFTGALFTPGRKNGASVKSALNLELLFGAPIPNAQARAPEGALWQPPRPPRAKASLPKEKP